MVGFLTICVKLLKEVELIKWPLGVFIFNFMFKTSSKISSETLHFDTFYKT